MKTYMCHLIKFPSGKYGFVGRVPLDLAFVDHTVAQQILTFETKQEAINFAQERNHEIKINCQ